MTTNNEDQAERLYQEAKQYNWRDEPADAALARSLFMNASVLGHARATCDLAGMMFDGQGGPKEQTRAIALLWKIFAPNGIEALEQLGELLGSYADTSVTPADRRRALNAVQKSDEALESLRYVFDYVSELARQDALASRS